MNGVRDVIAARRARAAEVAQQFASIMVDAPGEGWPAAEYRCTREPGCYRQLATAVHTAAGVFFISEIKWVLSDRLNLRPWAREHYLGAGLDAVSYSLCMTDDDFLADWVRQLDEWTARLPADGLPWLRKVEPTLILERVDSPQPLGARSLWVRCSKHLGAASALDPSQVLRDTRRAASERAGTRLP